MRSPSEKGPDPADQEKKRTKGVPRTSYFPNLRRGTKLLDCKVHQEKSRLKGEEWLTLNAINKFYSNSPSDSERRHARIPDNRHGRYPGKLPRKPHNRHVPPGSSDFPRPPPKRRLVRNRMGNFSRCWRLRKRLLSR
ncbi:hypothetical protein YC2023_045178 [Brassica napus]